MKNTNLLISVVTPSLNQGKFIEDAIISVLDQEIDDIEHIVIDGGSEDETLNILKNYNHLNWFSMPDNGQSSALNKGFKIAKGNIIGWLNADDYFLPGAFSKLIGYYNKFKNKDIFYGDFINVNENKSIIRKQKEHGYDPQILFYIGCYIPSSGTFFKASLFKEGLFLDESFHFTMDYEYYIRLSKAKKQFFHIPEYLSCFRWHGKNRSLNEITRKADRYRVQQMYGTKFTKNTELNQQIYNFLYWPFRLKRGFLRMINCGHF